MLLKLIRSKCNSVYFLFQNMEEVEASVEVKDESNQPAANLREVRTLI